MRKLTWAAAVALGITGFGLVGCGDNTADTVTKTTSTTGANASSESGGGKETSMKVTNVTEGAGSRDVSTESGGVSEGPSKTTVHTETPVTATNKKVTTNTEVKHGTVVKDTVKTGKE